MQILLCVVSDDRATRDMVNKAKGAIVPKTFREIPEIKSRNPVFDVRAVSYGAQNSIENLILAGLERWEGVCLLADDIARLSSGLSSACFAGHIAKGPDLTNVIAAAARLLTNYFEVLKYMSDKGSMEALALPIANFDAQELSALVVLFRQNAIDPLFVRQFTGHLAGLNARYLPRRPKAGEKKRYFQDDKGKHFDYGPEDHGQFDTGGAHTPLCQLTGNFRFGCKIPNFHHYNMMKAYKRNTWISGHFPGCHGQKVHIPGQSHVNIFANDFHKPK